MDEHFINILNKLMDMGIKYIIVDMINILISIIIQTFKK